MESEVEANSAPTPIVERAERGFGRFHGVLLGAWVVAFLACSLARALRTPIWYDELYTLYLAQLPNIKSIWIALKSGLDLNPPLSYLLTRGSLALFSPAELALRLPSSVGFAVMSLCLYRFVRRRLPAAFAWAAATFPVATLAYDYAFEGRPYALVLGFTGLALIGWQSAADGPRRAGGIALMVVSLAAAIYCHFFAVLVFLPIGFGELARAWSRKRIDLAVCVALVVALFPILSLRPLIKVAGAYRGTFWSKPNWAQNVNFYRALLEDATFPLFATLVLLVIIGRYATREGRQDEPLTAGGDEERVPLHEFTAALVLVALPFLGFLLAKIASGGAYTERYALPSVMGFALILTYGGARLRRLGAIPGVVMSVCVVGWFFLYQLHALNTPVAASVQVSDADFQSTQANNLPIVVSRSFLFLQAHRDLSPPLSKRLVFLTQGTTTDEIGLSRLSEWVPLKVEDFDGFVKSHARFYLCGYPADPVFRTVFDSRARLTMLQSRRYREGEAVLSLVTQDLSPPQLRPRPKETGRANGARPRETKPAAPAPVR
jgi:hypothetical protein